MVVDYSEDREILTLLRRGEISAFVDIYTTYFDALLNYADRLQTIGIIQQRIEIRGATGVL